MRLVKQNESTWDPAREIRDMTHQLNQTLGRTFQRWPFGEREAMTGADWTPLCNIVEDEKQYQIRADLPEVQKGDIKVEARDGTLSISGERRAEKEERGKKYHRVESSYGMFLRRFSLPSDADGENVSATFKDGVLTVIVPKSPTRPAASHEVAIS